MHFDEMIMNIICIWHWLECEMGSCGIGWSVRWAHVALVGVRDGLMWHWLECEMGSYGIGWSARWAHMALVGV